MSRWRVNPLRVIQVESRRHSTPRTPTRLSARKPHLKIHTESATDFHPRLGREPVISLRSKNKAIDLEPAKQRDGAESPRVQLWPHLWHYLSCDSQWPPSRRSSVRC